MTLAKLKSATVNGKTIVRPVTKAQKDIFDAFRIYVPDVDTCDHAPKREEQSQNTHLEGVKCT